MAGSAVSGAEILRMQAEGLARGAGASPSAIDEILRHHGALMAAAKDDASVAALASLARTLLAAQLGAVPRREGAAPGEVDPQAERLVAHTVTMLQTPWMRFFVTFDPDAVLRRLACPVFAAFGGRDVQAG